MRVLYLIDSLSGGGAERSLAALAPQYLTRGVQLEIAYLHSRPGLEVEIDAPGVGLHCLKGRGGRTEAVAYARRLVRRLRPTLIHTTLFEADIAGRVAGALTRTPVVSSLVNVAYGREQMSDPNLKRSRVRGAQLLDALTARRVVRFHAVSAHVADVMSRRLRIPRERVDVIPRGRDPVKLGTRNPERRSRVRADLGIGDDTPLVLAAARQEHQKGLDVLIQSWPLVLARIPQAQLLLAGRHGNRTDALESAIKDLGLHDSVRFLGPRGDVPDLLCAADAFAVPSRWEGLGGIVVEAMALEAPIVASSIPALNDLLSDGVEGSLVEPEDPIALAAALVQLLTDREGAADLAARARARFIERYTIDRIADEMIAFYERALSNGH